MQRMIASTLLVGCCSLIAFAEPTRDTSRGDRMISQYFRLETDKIQQRCLAEVESLDDWNSKKKQYRKQLMEMLGLDPLPERNDLKATITGKTEHEQFTVERLHFQFTILPCVLATRDPRLANTFVSKPPTDYYTR